MPSPQSREKFIYRSRAPHFRKRMSDARDGVRVAARNRDFSQSCRQPRSTLIGPGPHLPVARLKRRHIRFKPMKIFRFAAPSQPGENMIGAEEKFTFGEVHQQRYEIISTPVNRSEERRVGKEWRSWMWTKR